MFNLARFTALLLLIILAIAQGGKEVIGLSLYHIFSIVLFYFSFNITPAFLFSFRRPAADENSGEFFEGIPIIKSIHLPVFVFLSIFAISTIYSIIANMRGFIHFSTILIHCLNFYSILKIKDDLRFQKYFFNLIVAISVSFSIFIIFQKALEMKILFFFPNKNLLAGFLNLGMIILFCRIIYAPFFSSPKLSLLGNYFLLFVNMAVHLLIFSRGALLALSFGLLFLFWMHRKKVFSPLLVFAILALFIVLSSSTLRTTISSKILTAPDDNRLLIWQTAIHAFIQKPVFGWGLGSFGDIYNQFKLPIATAIARYEKTTPFVHSEFLEILVETGLLGLGCFLWMISAFVRQSFLSLKREDKWENTAAFTCLIVILSHALVDFNLHLPIIAFSFIVFSAILISSHQPDGAWKFRKNCRIFIITALTIWIFTAAVILVSEISSVYANSTRKKGNNETAVRFYKIAVFLNPFHRQNLYALAHLSEYKEKEKLLKRAILFHPGDTSLYRDLGVHYLQENRIDEAISLYEKAIKKNPKKVFYYAELAETYLAIGNINSAIQLYQKAVEIEPLYASAHRRLGEVYLKMGRKGLAVKYFQALEKIKSANLNPATDYERRLLYVDTLK